MENDVDDSIRRRRNILNYINELDYALQPFYRIDYDKLKNIKRIVKNLEQEIARYRFPTGIEAVSSYVRTRDKRVKLVGLLPLMLMSKEMFRTNKSIIEFSIEVLGIKLKRMSRPSRTRIIGEILSEVAQLSKRDLDRVLEKTQKMIRNKLVHTKTDFFMEWDSAIRRMRGEDAESEI